MTARLALVALVFGFSACAPVERSDPPIVNAGTLDATLSAMVEEGRAAGVAALVFEDGEEAFFGAFGDADREAGEPFRRDTLVQIYSMSKPIAGVALMTFYEQGRFSFDDPVADHIPELADVKVFGGIDADGAPILIEPRRPPTVADILRHTAGFYSDGANPDLQRLYDAAGPRRLTNTLPEAVAALAAVPLLYHPGEKWAYSDAVDVQALMVERFAGEPYPDYVRRTIFEPLGMNETSYFVEPERRGRMASLYRAEAGGLIRVPDAEAHRFNMNRWAFTPGGWGFVSTIDDYALFARMLLNEGALGDTRILKPETVRLMATDHLPETVRDRAWLPGKGGVGFGVDVAVRVAPPANDAENFGAVGEFFWDGLASTLFWVDPENDLTAVFFVQKIPYDGTLHKTFRDAVYDVMERGTGE